MECRTHRQPRHTLLYLVYMLWVPGLGALCVGRETPAAGLLGLALIFLICVFLPFPGGKWMFGKKTRPAAEMIPAVATTGGPEEGLTVIGAGSVVEGNLLQGKNVSIYGTFTGDIAIPAGTVSVHPGGTVHGNISAALILVGGRVEGECEGQSVTVQEQGQLCGTCRSTTFSIAPGGVFVGVSETLPEAEPTGGNKNEVLPTPFVQKKEVEKKNAREDEK